MRRVRWFHIVLIIFLPLLLMPLSPIYPAEECYPENNQTLVALTFDDGYSCWNSEVMPVLAHYDLTATAFINDPKIMRYFTWDDTEELHNAGWEIGWHTARHIDVSAADQFEIIRDFNNCQVLFKAHGLPPPSTFAYPYGRHDLTSMEIVAGYFLAARTCLWGVNSPCHVQKHPAQLKTISLGVSLASLKKEVNKYRQRGVLIVLQAHTVGEAADWQRRPEMTAKEFNDFAELLHDEEQQGTIDVVTLKEGVWRMQHQEAASSWSVKLDNPFSPCFDAYGLPVPQRYLTLYEKIVHVFIGHRYPQIADWLDGIILGPTGFLIFLGVVFLVVASIVITGVNLNRNRSPKPPTPE